ncbi:hypothetical protein G9A89_016818 [Geosiphon pyriformis]|nr:hypothetical protein G9A89_016818 [Geosiphon pyriformis]
MTELDKSTEPIAKQRSLPTRSLRAMSLPTLQTTSSSSCHSYSKGTLPTPVRTHTFPNPPPQSPHPSPLTYPDLPPDPKRWTSSNVAVYLAYCLRLYPPAVIQDLTRYVQEDTSLNGRRFLRLKEENLRLMGFNERWVKLIMTGVKALRRESLTQKILVNGSNSNGIMEEPLEEEFAAEEYFEGDGETTASTPSSLDDVFSETITSTDHSSISQMEQVNRKELNKSFNVSLSSPFLTAEDKEFICQELAKLGESFKASLASSPSLSTYSKSSFSSSNQQEAESVSSVNDCTAAPVGNTRSYGNGIVHGAIFGGMIVLACMKIFSR